MSHAQRSQSDDLSAYHGFFVLSRPYPYVTDEGFTENLILIYHSAVFKMPAHAYQMAMLASLPDDVAAGLDADIDQYGENSLISSGGYMRILHNTEPLTLQSIADAKPTMEAPYEFQASLKRKGPSDYVEFGPNPFMMSVRKILYFRPFDPDEQYPSESKYIFLPAPDGTCYVAHYLARYTDFDSIQKGGTYPPWGVAPGGGWDAQNSFAEVLLPGVPPYQGGDLPRLSPLAVGQSYSFVRVVDNSSAGEQAIRRSSWFDTTVINGDM